MMHHIDLCSGIGGFALGFQWAGLSKPVLFCDIEPWSRKILEKHWPDVPIAEDVKELASDPDGLIPRTDPKKTILTAGYPCQPFSHAGKRLGSADTDRHIWPYILQIVAHKRPAFCVFENVYGHVSLGLDQVLLDLETQGYATRPFIVPACAVDAPHRRDRVWIIANASGVRCDTGGAKQSLQRLGTSGKARRQALDEQRNAEERTAKDAGNASSSGQRGDNGRWAGQKLENGCENVAHTDSSSSRRRAIPRNVGGQRWKPAEARPASVQPCNGEPCTSYAQQGGETVADTDSAQRKKGRVSSGVHSEHSDTLCNSGRKRRQAAQQWLPEPSVGRVAHGIPKRVDRLRGLGNAIVPQIAMKIGEAIRQHQHQEPPSNDT